MLVTLLVVKLDKFNSIKNLQSQNIFLMLVTLLVLKLERFNLNKNEQFSNIPVISAILILLNFLKDIKLIHLQLANKFLND